MRNRSRKNKKEVLQSYRGPTIDWSLCCRYENDYSFAFIKNNKNKNVK